MINHGHWYGQKDAKIILVSAVPKQLARRGYRPAVLGKAMPMFCYNLIGTVKFNFFIILGTKLKRI
jgi:hypothetical protein